MEKENDFKSKLLNVNMSVYLGDFVKSKLEISEIEGVIVYDNILGCHIKLTGSSILNFKKQFRKNKILSDKKSEYNHLYMIPKAF